MSRGLEQIIGHRLATQQRRAAQAERLPERHQKQVRPDACHVATAPPFAAQHADTVGVIYHQQRLRALRQRSKFSERREIAIHAEHPFGKRERL
ncbi:hypothetical protein BN133_4388 [Cronobacter dublinensis 582]|nr:hypothetical protein BN133_4388 [Cronobacter dublinensis 582]